MHTLQLWNAASQLPFHTGPEILPGFSLGFGSSIPEDVKNALTDFTYWVEDTFSIPITLWVDFEYRHYLISAQGSRAGYRFYWVDFEDYPRFEKEADIPVIRLAVRTEHQALEDILRSYIRGISCYFAWLSRESVAHFTPDEEDVTAILQTYLRSKH